MLAFLIPYAARALAVLLAMALAAGMGWEVGRKVERTYWLEQAAKQQAAAAGAARQQQERADAAEIRYQSERDAHAETSRRMRAALRWATGRDCIAAPAADRLRDPDAVPATADDPAAPAAGPGAPSRAATDGDAIDTIERLTAYARACRSQVNAIRAAAGQ